MRRRGTACAVCKFRRQNCPKDCILEPYFPQDHPQQFQNGHNLFGVKNMITTLQNLKDQEKRDEAMRTKIYEANVRAKDPVGGCYRIVLQLKNQIKVAERELALVKERLVEFKLAYGVQKQNYPDQNYPDQPQNAHRLFSFNNVSKILTKIDQTRRQEAMRSMTYEANVRARDPVGGCCRIIRELSQQVRAAENELALVNQCLAFYKQADYGVQNQHEIINDEEFSMKDLEDLKAAFYLDDILDQDDHQNGR